MDIRIKGKKTARCAAKVDPKTLAAVSGTPQMTLLSKPLWVNHACHQYKHPWTSSCIDANSELLVNAFKYSLKFYSTLYVASLAVKGHILSKHHWKETFLTTLQSSFFLAMHVFLSGISICSMRNILGGANFYTIIFVPSIIGSFLAYLIERPARRKFLSIYIANYGFETLFNIGVKRGLIKPINNGSTYIFMLSSAALMYVYRAVKCTDASMTVLRYMIGPYEAHNYIKSGSETKMKPKARASLFTNISTFLKMLWQPITTVLRRQARHKSCPHPHGCIHYVTEGAGKMFAFGCVAKAALTLIFQMKKWIRKPSILLSLLFNKTMFNLAVFCGSFTGIARLTLCLLRWIRKKDSKSHGFIAGLLAGSVFYQFSNKTFAQYAMWKALEVVHGVGVRMKIIPVVPGGSIMLFSLTMACIFHAVHYDPDCIRPSYFKFMNDLFNGRLAEMSKSFQDTFGTGGKILKRVCCS